MDARSSLRRINIHDWQKSHSIDVHLLADSLQRIMGIDACTSVRHDDIGALAQMCRIRDTRVPFFVQPKEMRVPPEMPALYDGHELLRLAHADMRESPLDEIHIVVTDLLICTYDDGDLRYHARPVVASTVSLVSTSSAVWGPARSREYYVEIAEAGPRTDDVESKYAASHLVDGDARMPAVIEGYAMQAIFYMITREAFCEDPSCRLYNAHWQAQLLDAQIHGRMCAQHRDMLAKLTGTV